MKTKDLYLTGIASYVPPAFSAAEAVERGWYDAATHAADGWLGAAVAGEHESPAGMALRVARAALRQAGDGPNGAPEIDIVFYADSMQAGPYGWCPQHYVERHAVGRGVPAIELRQGCSGMLNAFDLAACYLAAAPDRHGALVVGAEKFTEDPAVGSDPTGRWRYWFTPGEANRGSILGDAATAVVFSDRAGFAQVLAVGSSSVSEAEELYRGGGELFPPLRVFDRPVRLGERFLDYGRHHPEAAAAAAAGIRQARTELALRTLDEGGVKPVDVTRVLHVFAGNPGYVHNVVEPLGIEADRGVWEFGREVGHLGVNDQVAALHHLLVTRALRPGDNVLMLSNGIGASLSCAVVVILADLPEEGELSCASRMN